MPQCSSWRRRWSAKSKVRVEDTAELGPVRGGQRSWGRGWACRVLLPRNCLQCSERISTTTLGVHRCCFLCGDGNFAGCIGVAIPSLQRSLRRTYHRLLLLISPPASYTIWSPSVCRSVHLSARLPAHLFVRLPGSSSVCPSVLPPAPPPAHPTSHAMQSQRSDAMVGLSSWRRGTDSWLWGQGRAPEARWRRETE